MASKLLTNFQVRVNDNGHVTLSALKSTNAFSEPGKYEHHFEKLKVYRSEHRDFYFCSDYAEYFDGLWYKDAELIYEGGLSLTNNRKFTFIDKSVETGVVYSYWLGPMDVEPVGPAAVKVRDFEQYWPYDKIRTRLQGLHAANPTIATLQTIGQSVRRRDIHALRIGQASKCVAMVGLIHPGESGPELMIPAVEYIVKYHRELLDEVALLIIPNANPDRREDFVRGEPWYVRTNANQVDLNRNFPADWDTIELGYGLDSTDPTSGTHRGPCPNSEPETQAIMHTLYNQRPNVLFSFHALAGICGARLLGPRAAEKDAAYQGNATLLGHRYAGEILPGQSAKESVCYATSAGSLPLWCYQKLQIPAFDIEISGAEAEAANIIYHDATTAELLAEYQVKHRKAVVAVMDWLAR